MPTNFDKDGFFARLVERLKIADFSDQRNQAAFWRIAQLLEAQAKINAVKQGVKDRGGLLTSIKFIVENNDDTSVVIQGGTPGIKYGAMNEFGGPFTTPMRKAMFAKLREQGRLQKDYHREDPVIVGNYWRPRPYIRPALVQHRDRIIDILRGNV